MLSISFENLFYANKVVQPWGLRAFVRNIKMVMLLLCIYLTFNRLSKSNINSDFNELYNIDEIFHCQQCNFVVLSSITEKRKMRFIHSSTPYPFGENRIYEIMRNLVTNYHFNTLNDNSGNNLNTMEEWTREVCIPMIPTHFWRAKMYKYLPISAVGRRKLMYELFDIRHMQFCCIETYHSIFTEHLSELCICIQCDKPLEHYQLYFGCNPYTEKPEFDVFK